MLLLHQPEDYRATLIHETAHAVVNELFSFYTAAGRRLYPAEWRHHGAIWREVVRHMGMEPDAFHDLDVVKAMPDKYLSQVCACGYRHQVGKRAVANAIAKGKRWLCGSCRRPLDLGAFAPTAAGGKRKHSRPKRQRPQARRWPRGIARMSAGQIADMLSGKLW